ncbi:PTTG1 interacting protein a isoform X1 [Gadus chalcogrammus]|uniref:PTTG1 interacting protein a isoform X1 n=2 Tax=Gadus chalcogrammus TaxID=1042646 RepID=UPI0024C2301F|nr:PTTG1 interacting protein a isoform X1 [Gadus chalcogrammus]
MDLRSFIPVFLILVGSTIAFGQASAPGIACELMNASNCEGCLANVSCLWCLTSEKCITYPVSTILPPHAVCPLNDARWGLCWMNFQILIITLSVVGAVIILAFIVCLLCCCKCQNCGSKSFDAKMDRKADKTKTKQNQRRSEMKERHEEIRNKYGLKGANPYSRFA